MTSRSDPFAPQEEPRCPVCGEKFYGGGEYSRCPECSGAYRPVPPKDVVDLTTGKVGYRLTKGFRLLGKW